MWFFAIIGILLLVAVLLTYNSFSWGLVLHKFYYWFLLPIFTGMPTITYWQAVGLVFILGLFQTHSAYSTAIKKEYKDKSATVTAVVLQPWLTLLVGYLVHILFIG